MRHRNDDREDRSPGHLSPGGPSAATQPADAVKNAKSAEPQLEDADLADKLDVDPERGDVKG